MSATVLDAMHKLKWTPKQFKAKSSGDVVEYDETDVTHWFEGGQAGKPVHDEQPGEIVRVKMVRWPSKTNLVVEFHSLEYDDDGIVYSVVKEVRSYPMQKYPHYAWFDNPPVILAALHDAWVYVNEKTGYRIDAVYVEKGWDFILGLSLPKMPRMMKEHPRDWDGGGGWDDYEGEGWFNHDAPY